MLFGSSGPLTPFQALFLAVVLYGAPLVCVCVYLGLSWAARKQANRKVDLPDRVNALFSLAFLVAIPWFVIRTAHQPLEHAVLVVLIPGFISACILAQQWKSTRHAVWLGIATALVAVMSIVLDPRSLGTPIIGTGRDMFFLEPILWLIAYGITVSRAAASHTPRSLIINDCTNCGYSRDGLPTDICPECGSSFSNQHIA
jgi:uncharacterized membrane protein